MWQRFSERARKVIFYAQEEAQERGKGYVSTEHFLLGLLRERENTACRTLESLGIPLDPIADEVEMCLISGEEPRREMSLTPRAKRVIDYSYFEARDLGHNYIGSEHILLGLIREHDGVAGRVLAKLGAKLDAARKAVRAIDS